MVSQFLWIHPFHELTPLLNYETKRFYMYLFINEFGIMNPKNNIPFPSNL